VKQPPISMSADTMTMLSRSMNYRTATVERQRAYADYCGASSQLDRAHAVERTAELASQSFESVAKGELAKTLGEITDREREIGLAFARYATFGRTDKV
jgi:hypothetical protein